MPDWTLPFNVRETPHWDDHHSWGLYPPSKIAGIS